MIEENTNTTQDLDGDSEAQFLAKAAGAERTSEDNSKEEDGEVSLSTCQ